MLIYSDDGYWPLLLLLGGLSGKCTDWFPSKYFSLEPKSVFYEKFQQFCCKWMAIKIQYKNWGLARVYRLCVSHLYIYSWSTMWLLLIEILRIILFNKNNNNKEFTTNLKVIIATPMVARFIFGLFQSLFCFKKNNYTMFRPVKFLLFSRENYPNTS